MWATMQKLRIWSSFKADLVSGKASGAMREGIARAGSSLPLAASREARNIADAPRSKRHDGRAIAARPSCRTTNVQGFGFVCRSLCSRPTGRAGALAVEEEPEPEPDAPAVVDEVPLDAGWRRSGARSRR